MNQNLLRFTPELVESLNDVAAFLALNNFAPVGPDGLPPDIRNKRIDCVILAGNCVLETAEGTFRLLRRGVCPRLLISGGIGHATEVLYRKIAAHRIYRTVATEGRAEAYILADIAVKVWGIDPSRILVEADSTNSGENARFSRRLLEDVDQPVKTILLVQDPTMQRRADATFRQAWSDRSDVSFLNWPTFTPRVHLVDGDLQFALNGISGLWPMKRFLTLTMGEIPRLRDGPHGYGPKGKGFIVHVDIPASIEAAYNRLETGLAGNFDSRSPIDVAVVDRIAARQL